MKNKYLIVKIYRKNTIKKVKEKIVKAGMTDKIDATEFLNIKLVSTIFLFLLIMIFSDKGFIIAPIISLLYFLSFESIILDRRINNRKTKLEREAIYFFETLSLTIESGRNLKLALEVTCESIDSELSHEFKNALEEVSLGKSLYEALDDMRKKIPSETINNTILNFRESNKYGNSILESLYNQIDYLRNQEILDIKAKIRKLPVKISIISVLLFLPIILLIILSPIVIQYLLG